MTLGSWLARIEMWVCRNLVGPILRRSLKIRAGGAGGVGKGDEDGAAGVGVMDAVIWVKVTITSCCKVQRCVASSGPDDIMAMFRQPQFCPAEVVPKQPATDCLFQQQMPRWTTAKTHSALHLLLRSDGPPK